MPEKPNEMAYADHCKRCDQVQRLPRSAVAERAAQALMSELETLPAPSPGKMVGVLLAHDAHGRQVTLRAHSGRLDGDDGAIGWVPPVPERDTSVDEARNFARLETQRGCTSSASRSNATALILWVRGKVAWPA